MTALADPLPSAWRVGLGRGRIEAMTFFRDKMAVCLDRKSVV